MMIHQPTGDIYASWIEGTAFPGDVDVLYKISTDEMATWGAEVQYNTTSDDYRRVQAGRSVAGIGGKFLPVFYDDDDTDVYCNVGNGITLLEVTAPGTRFHMSSSSTTRRGRR